MVASVQRFDVRLQQLLDAMLSIASDLSLPTVLQRIIESACKLVDARYGALGVVGEHGQLTDLVTSGVDDQTHQAVGRLPEFKGILGVLLKDPKPVRLRDLSEHPLAHWCPPPPNCAAILATSTSPLLRKLTRYRPSVSSRKKMATSTSTMLKA